MLSDREQEEALSRTYEQFSDERLLELAAKPDELTAIAHDVLARELRDRHLEIRRDPTPMSLPDDNDLIFASSAIPRGERQLWYSSPGDYVALAAAACTFYFTDPEQLAAAQTALALADIPSDSNLGVPQRLDARDLMLGVLPEDRDRARAILSAPMSDAVRDQLKVEADQDDWAVPSCPECHAPDALLVSVEPVNVFRCEECGYRWGETP